MRLRPGEMLSGNSRSKWPGLLLVAACAIGVSSGCTREDPQENEAYSGKVIARVNDTPIYEGQLQPELDATLQKFRKYGMQRDDPALVRRRRDMILDRLVGDQLIYQESQKLTIPNLEELVEEELQALQTKYGTGEHFERYLKSRRLSVKKLRESLRAKVQVAEYLKTQGVSDPEIPEAQVREAYQKNPQAYSRDEVVEVSHILVATSEDSDPEDVQRARQEAESLRERILQGESLAELAKQHSDCNSASGGGDLGYIKRGFMPAEFDRVAFSMEQDAISDIVQTPFGFHIIKVTDKKPAGTAPYEDVSPMIRKFLQQEESKKRLAAHIVELKKKAKIEILPDESLDA